MKFSMDDFQFTFTAVNGNLTLFSGLIDLTKYKNVFITQDLISVAQYEVVTQDMRDLFMSAKKRWPELSGITIKNGYTVSTPVKQVSQLWAF